MQMQFFSIEDLRKNKYFLDRIRWDITPKILFEPKFPGSANEPGKPTNNTDGYMFYIDVIEGKSNLMIMRNYENRSVTEGYLEGVPEDLLKEAANCPPEECVAEMHPINKKLEDWLKKEFGL